MKPQSAFLFAICCFGYSLAFSNTGTFVPSDNTRRTEDADSLETKKVMLISTNFNVPMVQYVPQIDQK